MTHRQISRSPERNDPNTLLSTNLVVPTLEPSLEGRQSALDVAEAEIVPKPEGEDAEEDVEPGAKAPGAEDVDEVSVELVDDESELVLGEDGIENLRVQVREGRGQVPGNHPVPLDPYDPRRRRQRRRQRHVRIRVRETRMERAPGNFVRCSCPAVAAAGCCCCCCVVSAAAAAAVLVLSDGRLGAVRLRDGKGSSAGGLRVESDATFGVCGRDASWISGVRLRRISIRHALRRSSGAERWVSEHHPGESALLFVRGEGRRR